MIKIRLGDTVECTITGFTGAVIGKAEYLHGCEQCEVQGTVLKDELPTKAVWIDEAQLEFKSESKEQKKKAAAASNTGGGGGPRDTSGMGRQGPER